MWYYLFSGESNMFLLCYGLYVGFNYIMDAGPEVLCVLSHLAPLQDQAYPVLNFYSCSFGILTIVCFRSEKYALLVWGHHLVKLDLQSVSP